MRFILSPHNFSLMYAAGTTSARTFPASQDKATLYVTPHHGTRSFHRALPRSQTLGGAERGLGIEYGFPTFRLAGNSDFCVHYVDILFQ